jgi:hypothetical protein
MAQQTENALTVIAKASTTPDQALPTDKPAMDTSSEALTIDLAATEPGIEPPKPDIDKDQTALNREDARRPKFSLLAASLVLTAVLGALGGTAATATFFRHAPDEANAAAALADETHAMQQRVAKLSAELAALKSSFDATSRSSASQLNRIGERLDRAEKAHAEPVAKLAKIAESLDRLERRTASVAPPPPEVTGSVASVDKQQSKPPTVEGWKLHDYRAGRALVESRGGTLFEVGPGSILPGVGKIETIKRVDGKIVITTPKGIIASSLDARRGPYYLPRGY